MTATPTPAMQQLQERQVSILSQVQVLESRLARLTATLAKHRAGSGAPAAADADAGKSKPKSKQPAADKAAAAAPKRATPTPAASPEPAASAAPLVLPSDEDPSRWWDASSYEVDTTGVVPRLSALAQQLGFSKSRFYRVKSGDEYYGWTLEQRRDALGLPTTTHLCKSVVMVNKEHRPLDEATGLPHLSNPRFVLVINSYVDKLHKESMTKALWEVHAQATRAANAADPKGPQRTVLPKKAFNLRLCEEADAVALTGYEHNGMTPLGLAQPDKLQFLLSDTVLGLEGGSLALGGGETSVKWRCSVREFVNIFKPIVAHIVA